MAIDVRGALAAGAEDFATARGVVLYVLFTVFALASLPVHHTLTRAFYAWTQEFAGMSPEELPIPPTPAALEMSVVVLAAAVVVMFLVSELLRLLAVRSFASESAATIPREDVARRFGSAFLALLAASVVVQTLVYVGAALILPAVATLFLTVFVRQAILLDDEGPIEAIRTSISITRDDPVSVVGLLVALFAISFLVGIPTLFLPPGTVVTAVAGIVIGTSVTVYGIAVVTRAYEQAGVADGPAAEAATPGDDAPADDGATAQKGATTQNEATTDEAAGTGDALDPRDLE